MFDGLRRLFTRRSPLPLPTVASAPESADPAVPARPRKRVEFPAFQTYLEARYADLAVLSFGQIEDLTGIALPDAARTTMAWWTGAEPASARYATAWQAAGRTALPNLGARNVAFGRIG